MPTSFLLTMLTIQAFWLVLFFALCGVGLLANRLFRIRASKHFSLFQTCWIGWILFVAFLQLWHLFFKIDRRPLGIVLTIGLAALIWHHRYLRLALRDLARVRRAGFYILLLIAGLWLSNRAVGPITNGDTGIYHMPSVLWAHTYPIVPGLGNLHGRLAYNSTYHLFAASLSAGLPARMLHYLPNGFLFFLLIGLILTSASRFFSEPKTISTASLFGCLLFVPTLGQVMKSDYYGLSPDPAVFVTGIMLTWLIIRQASLPASRFSSYNMLCIAATACVGVTTKVSFAPMAAAALLVATILWLKEKKHKTEDYRSLLLIFGVPAGGILVPWMIRGITLSGYPAFPVPVSFFRTATTMPRSLVLSELNWIRSWAREPLVIWYEVLGKWDWVEGWIRALPAEIWLSLGLTLASSFVYFSARKVEIQGGLWFLVPTSASLLSWLFSAPNPRFAAASFWILAIGMAALAIQRTMNRQVKLAQIIVCGLHLILFLYAEPLQSPLLTPPSPERDGLHKLPAVAKLEYSTKSNLEVNIPKGSNLCWDIELPCTPYPRPNLRLVDGKNIQKGFYLDKTLTLADFHMVMPTGFRASPNLGVAIAAPDFFGPTFKHLDWHIFEYESGVRWMISPATILLYSPAHLDAKMTLHPALISTGSDLGAAGELKLFLNDKVHAILTLHSEEPAEALLRLRPGFNVLKMQLAAGNFVPSQHIPDYLDSRRLGVAFRLIDFASVFTP